MSEPTLIYTLLPDTKMAEKIAQLLVSTRLIACANILPGTISVYHWQDKMESATEVMMFCKTTAMQAEAAMALIREHHPYRVPAILSLPVSGGNPDFLAWVRESVGEIA